MNLLPRERWLVVQSRLPQTDIRTYVDDMEAAIKHMQAVRRKDPKAILHAMEVLHMVEEE